MRLGPLGFPPFPLHSELSSLETNKADGPVPVALSKEEEHL